MRSVPRWRRVTLTSKGQITLPIELRRQWDLKAGDQLDFRLEEKDTVRVRKVVRRSIFEVLKDLPQLPPGPPLTQADIDQAVDEAMEAQERRVRERSDR
jgi:AbrB family looped-hinge helix DNA binding protein